MILDKDIKPSRSLYFIGARLIRILKENTFKKNDLNALYQTLVRGEEKGSKTSFDYYLLALDWLYLLGLIAVDANGDVQRCF